MKEKQDLESKIERLNDEIGQLKIQLESEEELYDKSEEKGKEKNKELEKNNKRNRVSKVMTQYDKSKC
ncbi:MAG: hypothetical protein ACR5KX_00905 [Wolbachia sp.]